MTSLYTTRSRLYRFLSPSYCKRSHKNVRPHWRQRSAPALWSRLFQLQLPSGGPGSHLCAAGYRIHGVTNRPFRLAPSRPTMRQFRITCGTNGFNSFCPWLQNWNPFTTWLDNGNFAPCIFNFASTCDTLMALIGLLGCSGSAAFTHQETVRLAVNAPRRIHWG